MLRAFGAVGYAAAKARIYAPVTLAICNADDARSAERARAAFGQELDWPAVVEAAAADTRGGGFIVQERVEVPLERHWMASSARVAEVELYVDYSAFCSVGLLEQPPWGGVVRGSASPIVNILGGGGVLPVLTSEVAEVLEGALAAPVGPAQHR